jgi:hypothetical protein
MTGCKIIKNPIRRAKKLRLANALHAELSNFSFSFIVVIRARITLNGGLTGKVGSDLLRLAPNEHSALVAGFETTQFVRPV